MNDELLQIEDAVFPGQLTEDQRQLMMKHVGFAVQFAHDFSQRYHLDRDALISEAYIGLAEAAMRYDESRGKFITYARWWILARLHQWMHSSRLVRLSQSRPGGGVNYQGEFYIYHNVVWKFSIFPLDKPIREGKDFWVDWLIDPNPDPETEMIQGEIADSLKSGNRLQRKRGLRDISAPSTYIYGQEVSGFMAII